MGTPSMTSPAGLLGSLLGLPPGTDVAGALSDLLGPTAPTITPQQAERLIVAMEATTAALAAVTPALERLAASGERIEQLANGPMGRLIGAGRR